MKNRFMLITLVTTILGMLIGYIAKDTNNIDDTYVDKGALLNEEIQIVNKNIKKLNKEKDKLEEEFYTLDSNDQNIDKLEKVKNLKEKLSYTEINGYGLSVTIDAVNEEVGNIASIVESNKILINIVNELKINGGEYISINNQRINQYSGIILAGSHININSVPIAPPYEIMCLGDKYKLEKYSSKESTYFKSIKRNYPISIKIILKNNLSLNKISTPYTFKYIDN